jgi:general nucleoside transport system ATP-binding protein
MLELRQLSRHFGNFRALDGVDFSVRPGEIVGLLGENGAGKSTLLKIIGGELPPTAGEFLFDGTALHLRSPREATLRGIGVVHQHFMLVPNFTVAENIALHTLRGVRFKANDWENRIEEWAASLGWRIKFRARVEDLSVGEQQRVEILKALFAGEKTARFLLLDEPTANLTPGEANELFVVLRRLKAQGCGLVFVSHKLHEVLELCDRVVVLRHGKVTGQRLAHETTPAELASLMVGRDVDESTPRPLPSPPVGTRRFQIKNLSCGALRDFSLTVCGGEIVGLAGVDGNGQRELIEALAGLQTPSGTAQVFEVDSPLSTVDYPLGLIPADRQQTGLILNFDLAENLALHSIPRRKFARRFGFDWKGLRALARDLITRFDVRVPAQQERASASQLSGGNQQKLVIARALSFHPGAVVAADPSRGLDVGATRFVHDQLRASADSGTPVLLISTDLDEILHLSDRIGVLYEGRLLPNDDLLPAGTPREIIGALMGGSEELRI